MNQTVRLVGVQPDSPLHGLEGVKHLETSLVPGIWDPSLADEMMFVATEDAQAATRRSEEHTSELQSPDHLVCRLLLEKKKRRKKRKNKRRNIEIRSTTHTNSE